MPSFIFALFSRALAKLQAKIRQEQDALEKEKRRRNKILSEFGTELAVAYPTYWKQFYNKKAPERVSVEVLEDLLAEFYRTHRHLDH